MRSNKDNISVTVLAVDITRKESEHQEYYPNTMLLFTKKKINPQRRSGRNSNISYQKDDTSHVDFVFWQACTAIMENASWIFCGSPWRCRVSLPLRRGCWNRASSLDLSLRRTTSPSKLILTLRSGVLVCHQWSWIRKVAGDISKLNSFFSPPFPFLSLCYITFSFQVHGGQRRGRMLLDWTSQRQVQDAWGEGHRRPRLPVSGQGGCDLMMKIISCVTLYTHF